MSNLFTSFLMEDEIYKQILESLEGSQYIHGMSEESLPHFAYSIFENTQRPVLVLTSDEAGARALAEDISMFPGIEALNFPRKEINFHDIQTLEEDALAKRQEVINACLEEKPVIITASADSLVAKLSAAAEMKELSFSISLDDELDIEEVEENLISLGYQRETRVGAKGEFAVRGGIIDIFPSSYKDPVRIELFDTEIDSMRLFDPSSQRSVGELDEISIYPAKQLVLTSEDKKLIAERIRKDLEAVDRDLLSKDALLRLDEKYNKIIDKLENGLDTYNEDLLVSYLDESSLASFFDYFNGIIIYDDMDKVFDRLSFIEEKYMEDLSYQIGEGVALKGQEKRIYTTNSLLKKARKKPNLNISLLKKKLRVQKPDQTIKFMTRELISYAKRFDALVGEIKRMAKEGYRLILATGNENLAKNLYSRLENEGLDLSYQDDLDSKAENGQVFVTPFSMAKGFSYESNKTVIITHNEIYGRKRKKAQRKKKKPSESLSVSDLSIDDYVVHENHGIAIYKGLEEIEVAGVKKDYLILEYKGTDKLYIPTDQMDLIQRYISTTDKKPRLSKLGSPAWAKTKARAKRQVEEIADELVKLYAIRAKEKGFAFSKDSEWQKEFEMSFEYEETPAQLRAIKEIKEDMESDKVMDRILLGDVGFGKTEVAVRAAFKAILDGKQVALLVPTTILAQQHYSNIKERFEGFPVNVDMVSRFRTKGQQKATLERLRDGQVDLLIGTHRILSKDVRFKDLGLLIIDEEQRFGVRDKEKMKAMKENIDVLTLSATPIPRTLQMGLVGIRDMSFLDEGPKERLPSSVYVMEYDEQIIKDAIRREIERDGQVYFVYNRVEGMDKMTRHIKDLVPEAEIVMAHGQMGERQLEKIMMDFAEGEYDILVSTSIIETGMDIHNVNTMIIYNADHMGLSQLYQLKGRIGRSSRSSFAYFTYKPGKSLTEISEKRLKAIKDFAEYGSGLKIAMRDLELRGAGNILGESQSGHIDSIGYDLYMKYLEEAIGKSKNEAYEERNEVQVDLNIDSYIPSDYIESTDDKVEIYKRIAETQSRQDYYDIIDELTDRFSDPPIPVVNTINIALIKNMASKLNILRIFGDENEISLAYESRDEYNLEDLEVLSKKFGSQLSFDLSKRPNFTLKDYDFDLICEFLETIADFQGVKLYEDLQED